jgi:hypothetical protein
MGPVRAVLGVEGDPFSLRWAAGSDAGSDPVATNRRSGRQGSRGGGVAGPRAGRVYHCVGAELPEVLRGDHDQNARQSG